MSEEHGPPVPAGVATAGSSSSPSVGYVDLMPPAMAMTMGSRSGSSLLGGARRATREGHEDGWRLPVEVFADKRTPPRRIRRMRGREVRQYYYALNDMIDKYVQVDQLQQRFERRMRRLRSLVDGEGRAAPPYSWYGSSDDLAPGNWMNRPSSSSSSSSSGTLKGLVRDEERQLPNHHYYRPHDRPKRDDGERMPLMPSKRPAPELMMEEGRRSAKADREDGKEEDDDEEEEEEKRRQAEREENSWHIQLAIHATFWINVMLFFAKTFASIESLSLSIIASALDSFLDLLSGSVIFFASWIVNSRSRELRFPGGTSRIEPLAVLIFAVAMFTGKETTPPQSTLPRRFLSQETDAGGDTCDEQRRRSC